MKKHGFVYIWFDRKHKRYYIGCHWGLESDGYICSSGWMKQAYRHRPQDFKRRILKNGIARDCLINEEHKWLSLIKPEELGKKYYNLRNHHFSHWATNPDVLLTVGEKISKALTGNKKLSEKMKGNTNGRGKKGKPGTPTTEETKKKLSEAGKRAYAEGRRISAMKGKPAWNSGKTGVYSEEARRKISEAGRGRFQSPQTRLKKSISMKATMKKKWATA